MRRSLLLAVVAFSALGVAARAQSPSRCVFAHYMVACPTYGATLDGYKREIQDAQANGIDGFALNCADWTHDPAYRQRSELMFQAAERLGNGFKLFFSPCWPGVLSPADLQDMILSFAGRPNYFHWGGQAVLSAYNATNGGTQTDTWWSANVLGPLAAAGQPVFFVPNSHLVPEGAPTTTANVQAAYDAWWHDVVGGAFYFGAAGLPVDDGDGDDMDNTWHVPALIAAGKSYVSVLHGEGKLYMAPVTPQYWGDADPSSGRRYFEFQAGQGLAAQWEAILSAALPDWIELVTWNDWNEATYFTPVDDFAAHTDWPGHDAGFYQTHRGLAALQRYYIAWYKAGAAPPITRDDVFYAYRTQPAAAAATDDPNPVSSRYGPVADVIYATTMLTAPADLLVITGGVTKATYSIPAGITHLQIPFNPGSQVFKLRRGSTILWWQEGTPIDAAPAEYNFQYYSGSTLTLPPGPTGLTAAPSSGQVVLTWNPFAGAASYNVKSRNPSDGSTQVLATGVTGTTWTDAGAANGITAEYVVSAVTANGEGSNSDPVCATPCGTGIVVDNASPGVSVAGTWSTSSGAGEYGTNFLHDGGAGGGKSVTFTPDLPAAGSYQVYARWTTNANRASNVPIDVVPYPGAPPQTVTVNQQRSNAQWVLLGTYSFGAGTGGSVTIRDDGAIGYVIADAVQFVPAPVVKDNADPTGVTVAGYWPAGTSAGYYGTNYLQDADAGGGKSVKFAPDLPAAGSYRVYLRWAASTNRATNAPVDVVDGEGVTHTAPVDQKGNGGRWNYLGTYPFDEGAGGYVKVRDDGADGYVIADAVLFAPD